ncbi:AAA family ATPase [Leifsonia sp. ZF2019]|uniref:ATP-binding protein n=1 Tax=Leifsonia sp. ZF2019 TaxID=2781978 RepID=UPI0021DA7FC7|nr:ATP-binding protein [Leifsonia sp. ZF2019]UAJ78855.1 AAA family ATPase [Leifsonia sp. ZF2019]
MTKVKVHGFGRLADGSMDLGPRVIAVVGPNEAGKSTFLDALAYLTDQGATLPTIRRSRSIVIADDTTVVTGYYVLDEADSESFASDDLEELPRALELSRRAGSTTRYMTVTPPPEPSRGRVAALIAAFLVHYTPDLVPPFGPETELDESEREMREQVTQALAEAIEEVRVVAASGNERDLLPGMRDQLESIRTRMAPFGLPAEQRSHLDRLIDWIDTRDRGDVVRTRMGQMLPVALLFSDADRNLPSTFALDDSTVNEVPAAVQNLADMAGLSIPDLWLDIQKGDRAGYGSKMRKANRLFGKSSNWHGGSQT